MSRNFDAVIANNPGAQVRTELNDWAQDWLTNRSGSGLPSLTAAYMSYYDTTQNRMMIRDGSDTTSAPLFDAGGRFRPNSGAVSAPAYAFHTEANTGFYLSTTNTVNLAIAGTSVLQINASVFGVDTPVIFASSSAGILTLNRSVNSGSINLTFQLDNSSNNDVNYAALVGGITTNTAGSEVGFVRITAQDGSGSQVTHTTFAGAGGISTGSATTQITNTTGTLRHAAIEQNGATTGQVLAWNGSAWAPSSAGSGSLSGSGTTNRYAYFDASTNLTSGILENTGTGVIVNGNLAIEGVLTAGSGLSPETVITDVMGRILLTALDTDGASESDGLFIVGGVPAWSAIVGLDAADGSAGSPAFGFVDDVGLGMYRVGADTLGFSTAATARVTIGSTGLLAVLSGLLDVGVADTTAALVNNYGDSGTQGARERWWNAAGEDTNIEYAQFEMIGDGANFGPATDPDMFAFAFTGGLTGTFAAYATLVAGVAGVQRGGLNLTRGTGTNQPAFIVKQSKGGTLYYFWVTDTGVLRRHTSAPSDDTSGVVVGGILETLSISGAGTLSPANANVVLSPTGSGLVTINPATAGTINNMSIGATTRRSGAFTTLAANSTVTLGGNTTVSGGYFAQGAGAELTLASDAITVTHSYHTLQPESGTTDNLSTINGGTVVGQKVVLICTDSADTITVKNGTGNIVTRAGADVLIGSVFRVPLELIYIGSNLWRTLS